MIKRIHRKHWSKKLNRRELGIVWTKIDAPYTYIDLNDNKNYQGLSSRVVSLMTKYMVGREVDLKNNVEVDGAKYLLSTVSFEQVGCFHRLYGYNYETMLFAYDGEQLNWDEDLYCERYADKEKAAKRHYELLQLLNNGEKFWE